MPFDPPTHHRRSIRRPGYDYGVAGAYFVTICAQNRSCLFGRVMENKMILNDAGKMVAATMRELNSDGIEIDEAIIMPNHVHIVILLHAAIAAQVETSSGVELSSHGTRAATLGRVIQRFKSLTTNAYIRGVQRADWPRFSGHLWQRDYFDHIIRNDHSFQRICEYIRTNPERWGQDADNADGSGSDDVRIWVGTLICKMVEEGEHEIRPYEDVDATAGEGEHKVRPYGSADTTVGEGEHEVRPYEDVDVTAGEGERKARLDGTFRIGHGYDLHRLGAGGRLMLGGIEVSREISPVAHSDGDVVLHALVDALLGAMGWGDIGELFPNTDPQWKDAPSQVFVDEVMGRVTRAEYAVGNVDVTILAERPRLKAFKPDMARSVARMLRIDPTQVNIKAGTNEGCDAIGRGEAIAAHAVVLLARRV